MIDGAGLKAEVVRRVHRTLSDLHATTDPRSALDGFCESLYDLLQCRAVVVHLAEQDDMVGVAYGGDPSVQALVGRRQPVQMWHSLLEASTPQGTLRFCRDTPVHLDALSPQTLPSEDADEQFGDEEHWGARNLLLAPLTAGGELVGAVSLSMPMGAPPPGEFQCSMLEIFALQAAVAIHQHRISERAAADHLALRLSEERFRLAFDNAPIGVAEIIAGDGGAVIARINRAAGAMFGASVIGSRHEPVDQVFAVMRGEPLSTLIIGLLERDRSTVRVEVPFIGSDGGEFWGLVEAASLETTPGQPGVLCQIVDITQAKAEERELTKLAQHDALTGLPNRLVIMDRLDAAVREATEQGTTGALLFCDLDDFKSINDKRGHLVGDDALVALATRLHSVVRTSDTAGRFGGDEFVVISFPLPEEAAELLAERISVAMSAPMEIEGDELAVGVSIGIAMITPGMHASELLKRADAAMYAVRSRRDRPLYVLDAG
ncbi:MAG: diguanylate cyclase domain-containing protein [Nocardioidaceae bacterium]